MEKKFRKQTSQMHLLEGRLEESMNKCAVLEQEKESLREDIGRLVEEIEIVGKKHQEEFASKELENVKLINFVDQTNAESNAPHQQRIRYQMSRVLAGCNASAAISPHSTSAQR